MVPTIEWSIRKYKEFNLKYFNGELIIPQFELTHSRSRYGCVSFRTRNPKQTLKLKMSNFYDVEEQFAEMILLHEMCHVYFIQNGDIKEHHGNKFKSLVRRLNNQYNLNIAERCASGGIFNENFKRKSIYVYIGYNSQKRKYLYFTSNKPIELERFDYWIESLKILGRCISNDIIFQGRNATMTDNKSTGRYLAKEDILRIWLNGKENIIYDILTTF